MEEEKTEIGKIGGKKRIRGKRRRRTTTTTTTTTTTRARRGRARGGERKKEITLCVARKTKAATKEGTEV